MDQPKKESPFACVMEAIKVEQRDTHIANARSLFNQVIEISDLSNGYSFSFNSEESILPHLAEFIELEKLCCPFFGFTIDVEPEGGEISLRLTGREGVKEFIRAEIGEITGRPIVPTGSGSFSNRTR